MTAESEFIAAMRALATDPGARGLMDDAAVLQVGGATLVLTKDMIVEGVHYRSDDPAGDVAWKLVAVNLSDLAAKGARPVAVMLGYSLGNADWDREFAAGLQHCLAAFGLPLIGGDTVSAPGPRVLSLTAIGEADGAVPSRRGAKAGDHLWVTGSIGDAGAGLTVLCGHLPPSEGLVARYRTPPARLEAGQKLAPLVSAMMDVSDGLLIDAGRMGHASGIGVTVKLDQVPLSSAYIAALGEDRSARLRAATAGDDYELLFAAAPDHAAAILSLAQQIGLPCSRIGGFAAGGGLMLQDAGGSVALPERLGFEHRRG